MLKVMLSGDVNKELAPHIGGFTYAHKLLSWDGELPSVFVFVYSMAAGQSHVLIKKVTGAKDIGEPMIEVSFFDGTTETVTDGYQYYLSNKEAEL